MARLLIVEDNEELVRLLRTRLDDAGFLSDVAPTAEDALFMVKEGIYAAMILDLGLPDADGLSVLRQVRADGNPLPVLVLTARGAIPERVAGLSAGADDYLIKPFATEELIARIHVLLRRPQIAPLSVLVCGNLTYDPTTGEVQVDHVGQFFTRRELQLIDLLIRRSGRVVRKQHVEATLFGLDDDLSSNAIEVYVHRLRRRLEQLGASVEITTIRGVGYMLDKKKP